MKKLVFVDPEPSSVTYKMVYFLRKEYEVVLIALSSDFDASQYRKLGCKVIIYGLLGQHILRNPSIRGLKLILRVLINLSKIKRINPDVLLVRTEPNWPAFLFRKVFRKAIFVYFPYDIASFRFKNPKEKIPDFEFKCEKFAFENADLVLHKGPKNELSRLEKYKIKGERLQFLPACFDEWIMPIKKKKMKGMNLVYGGVAVSFDPGFSMAKVFSDIADQGINFHLYPTSMDEDIKKLAKHKYFHLHKRVDSLTLNELMRNYHFGTRITFETDKNVSPYWHKTTLSNKIFSYLEAGIPTIVDNKNKFVADLIKKFGIGIIVSREDINNLKNIIKKHNYKKLVSNVEKARKKLNVRPYVKKLISQIKNIERKHALKTKIL